MSNFNLEIFLINPSLQELKSLKKSELQQIVMHFTLLFTVCSSKGEIYHLFAQHFIDEELVPEPEDKIEEPQSPVMDFSVVELKHLELNDREQEREANLKFWEVELRKK